MHIKYFNDQFNSDLTDNLSSFFRGSLAHCQKLVSFLPLHPPILIQSSVLRAHKYRPPCALLLCSRVYGESRARVHAFVFTAMKSIQVLSTTSFEMATQGRRAALYRRVVATHVTMKIAIVCKIHYVVMYVIT